MPYRDLQSWSSQPLFCSFSASVAAGSALDSGQSRRMEMQWAQQHYRETGLSRRTGIRRSPPAREELPLTVRDAATYLGVSPQTVYLWVERKQIPHLRVMGRNIRFLKSELEPFRATFKQEVGNGKTSKA